MSPCKAILHTPHMMYGGREDMCPHLHTITLYYLISFHLAILSQEGGHIACSPNNISTFFFIFVSTTWRQYVKRREEAINAWWGLGPWSLVHLGPRTLVLEPYKQIFPKLVLTLSNRLNVCWILDTIESFLFYTGSILCLWSSKEGGTRIK